MGNEFHGGKSLISGIAIAFIAGLLVRTVTERLVMTDITWLVLYMILCLSIVTIISFGTITSIKDRQNQNTQEQNTIEWKGAIELLRETNPKITERISKILLREANNSFTNEVNNSMEEEFIEEKIKIKARFIENVYNELFVREKEES